MIPNSSKVACAGCRQPAEDVFHQRHSMDGGIRDWREKGISITKGKRSPLLSVGPIRCEAPRYNYEWPLSSGRSRRLLPDFSSA
jgi:hypothetical protein